MRIGLKMLVLFITNSAIRATDVPYAPAEPTSALLWAFFFILIAILAVSVCMPPRVRSKSSAISSSLRKIKRRSNLMMEDALAQMQESLDRQNTEAFRNAVEICDSDEDSVSIISDREIAAKMPIAGAPLEGWVLPPAFKPAEPSPSSTKVPWPAKWLVPWPAKWFELVPSASIFEHAATKIDRFWKFRAEVEKEYRKYTLKRRSSSHKVDMFWKFAFARFDAIPAEISSWCSEHGVPDVAESLASNDLRTVEELGVLSEEQIEVLCVGLSVGACARFKVALQTVHTGSDGARSFADEPMPTLPNLEEAYSYDHDGPGLPSRPGDYRGGRRITNIPTINRTDSLNVAPATLSTFTVHPMSIYGHDGEVVYKSDDHASRRAHLVDPRTMAWSDRVREARDCADDNTLRRATRLGANGLPSRPGDSR